MRSVVFSLVITIALLAFGATAGRSQIPLEQVDRIYEFGEVGIGFDIYHTFKLYNYGDKPLRIDSAIVRCDCSRVWIPDSVVPAGDTGLIGLHFNTEDYYGKISKLLKVWVDAPIDKPLEYFYLSTVGQWFMAMKPDPISLFFLPGNDEKTVTILNSVVEWTEISEIEPYNDFVTADIKISKAEKGEKLEIVVKPRPGLTKGTYLTNFRVTLTYPEDYEPKHITIPVKVVRY